MNLVYFMILRLQKLVSEQYEAAKGVSVPKLTDAFKTPKLRRTMLLIAFAQYVAMNIRKEQILISEIICSPMNMLVFDGHVRNIVNLKYDINSTFTISSAVEVNSVIDRTEC